MDLKEYIRNHQILTDGAMGTYYGEKYQKAGRSPELVNISHPERIIEIHKEYLKAGAELIRTNSFASNLATLFGGQQEQEFSREEQLRALAENVKAAYRNAKAAAAAVNPRALLAGDIGPIPEHGAMEPEELLEEYFTIADALLLAGAEIIWFETFSDFQYILPVAEYVRQKKDVFIHASFCLNKFGYTRSGISAQRILRTAEESRLLDGVGFNCGIGSTHMYQILKNLDLGSLPVSVIPNSGYPDIINDRTGYQENTVYFCENMKEIGALGVNLLGGCCGTTPAYIQKLRETIPCGVLNRRLWEAVLPEGAKKIPAEAVSPGEGKGRSQEEASSEKRRESPRETETGGEKRIQKERNGFYRKLQEPGKVVVVELDPPHDGNCEKIIQSSLLLKEAGADLITFSDCPMGKLRADSIMTGAKIQREIEHPVMPHVTCRDRNRLGIGAAFMGAHMNGIRNMLLITGDPVPGGDRSGISPVFDFHSVKLMEYLREMNQEYFWEEPIVYGGALNYGRPNLDKEIERMKRKCEAGADYFLTQPIYSKEDVARIAYVKERVDTRILCGIMPLVSYRNANYMKNEVFGIHVPEEIVARYHKDMSREEGEAVGISIALEIAEQLRELADGYYFMVPFNRASMICTIMKRMREQCLI